MNDDIHFKEFMDGIAKLQNAIYGIDGGTYTQPVLQVATVRAITCQECGALLPKPETCRCRYCGCWNVVTL